MNLTLQRDAFLAKGIFGTLFNNDKSFSLFSLEHAYPESTNPTAGSSSFVPKISSGDYICVRGTHTLSPTVIHPNPQPFETFEITGVVGHTGLLFHVANFNEDLSGCIGVGTERNNNMIMNSVIAFEKFMQAQVGCDSFILSIL